MCYLELNGMKRFKNIISLGHFCSPAMEFERLGCRKYSFPFDWLITPNLNSVMDLIENHFTDFLNEEYMYQLKQFPSYYRNIKVNVDFYHDFSPLKSFDSQILDTSNKYKRRIERFYNQIKSPTLFCRYITKEDYENITETHNRLLTIIKDYNKENDIVYIANSDVGERIDNIKIYYVDKDPNDGVSRVFLEKLPDLKEYILDVVESYEDKRPKKKTSILTKVYKKLRLKFNLVYKHNKQI